MHSPAFRRAKDVAGRAERAYVRSAMAGRLLSLLALLALALMPFGMAAPATAAPAGHEAVMAMDANEHCPQESSSGLEKSVPGSHCVAACSVLLPHPAMIAPAPLQPRLKLAQRTAPTLADCTPETSTPPPKVA
jgi:hypothetical protein